jgi:hypothetical protein
MKKLIALGMVMTAAALVGCGDDTGGTGGGGSNTPNGDVSPQVAQSNVTTSVTASRTAIGGDGVSAAYQLSSLGTSALGLVGPAGSQPQSENGQAKQALQTGVCECDAINGTISWANGNVVADLRYAGSDVSGSTYDFGVVMNVNVTETSIDGSVESDGSVTAQGANVSWDSSIQMNDVQFNTSGCPTSGSIDVDASVSYASAQSYSGQETITFDGSGC